MVLPENAISTAARELRSVIAAGITDMTEADIFIGHPKWAIDKAMTDKQNINLFFYHLSVDSYPADGTNEQPFYVRIFCLITPLGIDAASASVMLGENDLRLVGEVMAILHKNSTLKINDGSDTVALLEIVPADLKLENLNHIWSTQGDSSYRLSLAYELSLAPVPLKRRVDVPSPLVGSAGANALDEPTPQQLPAAGLGLDTMAPPVSRSSVDQNRTDWAPLISFVDSTGKVLEYVYQKDRTSLPATLKVLVAAPKDEKVRLVWEVWERRGDGSKTEWAEAVADTLHAEVTMPGDDESGKKPTTTIDPEMIDTRRVYTVKTPIENVAADAAKRQAVLHAIHDWTGEGMSEAMPVRSNPLLVFVRG